MIILGNLISFAGCMLMVIIGFIKDKDKILLAQCGQFSIMSVGNLILGSVSGSISGVIAVIRIVVFKHFKVTVWLKIGFIALQFVLTAIAGAETLVQWIPPLSMVLYTWFLDTDSAIVFKLANVSGVIMWVFHDWYFKNYVSCAFNVFTIVSTFIGIWLILREKKKHCRNQ